MDEEAAIESYLRFLPRPENAILKTQILTDWAKPLAKFIGLGRGRGRPRRSLIKTQCDIAMALMLLKLVGMGFRPTRRARKRFLEKDKSASAVVATFCQHHGVNIREPSVEHVWRRLKKGRPNFWDETKLIEYWWAIEGIRNKSR